jgi:hypothetical protein
VSRLSALCLLALVGAGLLATGVWQSGAIHRNHQNTFLGTGDSLADVISGTYTRPDEAAKSARPAKVVSVASCRNRDGCRSRKSSKPPSYADGYRTVCVRLCDGYFFPISASVSKANFARDELICQNGCSSPAKLFVYRNRDGSPETMTDIEGHPYLGLVTAFRYRVSYDASCTCKPQPWSQEASSQHRIYALAEARANGSLSAAAELPLLRALVRDQQREARAKTGAPPIRTAGAPPADLDKKRVASSRSGLKSRVAVVRTAVRANRPDARAWSTRAQRSSAASRAGAWQPRGIFNSGRVRVTEYRVAVRVPR